MGGRRSFDTLFTMTLVCAFILISMLLVALGANLYRKSSDNADTAHQLRTSVAYVSNKITADGTDRIYQKTVDGTDCICIDTQANGVLYTTYIYFKGGALCEFVGVSSGEPSLDFGMEIVRLGAFTFELGGNTAVLRARATDDSCRMMTVYLPQGGTR